MQNDRKLRKLIKTFSVNNRTNSNVVIEEIEEPTPRKIEELKAKILTLETYIRNQDQVVKQNHQRIDALEEEKNTLQQQLATANLSLEQAFNYIQNPETLEKLLEQQKADIEQKDATIRELENWKTTFSAATANYDTLVRDLDAANKSVETLTQQVNEKNSMLSNLNDNYVPRTTVFDLETKNRELTEKANSLQEELNKANEYYNKMEVEKTKYEEASKYSEVVKKLTEENEQQKSRISELEASLASYNKLTEDYNTLLARHKNLENTHVTIEEHNVTLGQLKVANENLANEKAKTSSLESKVKSLEESLTKANSSLETFNNMKSIIESAKDIAEVKVNQLHTVKEKKTELYNQYLQYEMDLNQMAAALNNSQNEIVRLNNVLIGLKGEADGYVNSLNNNQMSLREQYNNLLLENQQLKNVIDGLRSVTISPNDPSKRIRINRRNNPFN